MDMLTDFTEALQEITEAKGRFNRDPLIHAQNAVVDMATIAADVLLKHLIQPRRDPKTIME